MKENKASATSPSSPTARRLFVPSSFRTELLSDLKGAPLSVYLAYHSYANKDGLAWPSLRTLAAVTGYGINAVKAARRYLVTMGLLVAAEQSRPGGRFGRKDFQICTVARKQAHGTVASSTVAPSTVARCTVARKQCQEGSPFEGVAFEGSPKGEGDPLDAVRRRFDAEHRISAKGFFSPSEKKKKLTSRLTKAVQANRNTFDDQFDDDHREAFKYIKYNPLNPQALPCGFVDVVWDVYEDRKSEAIPPGILCSKIIDRCMSEQKACKKLGSDPSEYFWPPDFQDHRDRLRAEERKVKTAGQRVQA